MSVLRRCDNCRREGDVPKMLSLVPDDWYALYQPGERDALNFCTANCVTDYFTSKKLIEGAT